MQLPPPKRFKIRQRERDTRCQSGTFPPGRAAPRLPAGPGAQAAPRPHSGFPGAALLSPQTGTGRTVSGQGTSKGPPGLTRAPRGAQTRAGPPAGRNSTLTRQILQHVQAFLHVQAFFRYQPQISLPLGRCSAPSDSREDLFCVPPECPGLHCSNAAVQRAPRACKPPPTAGTREKGHQTPVGWIKRQRVSCRLGAVQDIPVLV